MHLRPDQIVRTRIASVPIAGGTPALLEFIDARAVASLTPEGAIAEWYGTFTQWSK
ncbi:MAG: hypothetical protein K8F91_08670 [Candidatus Obscuribacterales bacterium]|nr:hypothetical protein [Candidatus Obscuribacterales bacterium]